MNVTTVTNADEITAYIYELDVVVSRERGRENQKYCKVQQRYTSQKI
jgi:hypothetical protein